MLVCYCMHLKISVALELLYRLGAVCPLKQSHSPELLCSSASLGPQPGSYPVTERRRPRGGERGRESASGARVIKLWYIRESMRRNTFILSLFFSLFKRGKVKFSPTFYFLTHCNYMIIQLAQWQPAKIVTWWEYRNHYHRLYLILDITRSIYTTSQCMTHGERLMKLLRLCANNLDKSVDYILAAWSYLTHVSGS